MKTKEIYTASYTVHSYETDPAGRASMPALCRFMEDAAGNHARRLGVGMEQLTGKNATWVLSRLHFKVDRRPCWNDEIQLETWPSRMDRLFALREFRLCDAEGRSFMTASSAWMVIDLDKRRPLRPQAFFEGIPLPEEQLFSSTPAKLEPQGDEEKTGRVTVPFSSLDLNGHVNNVAYLNWGLDQFSRNSTGKTELPKGRSTTWPKALPERSLPCRPSLPRREGYTNPSAETTPRCAG